MLFRAKLAEELVRKRDDLALELRERSTHLGALLAILRRFESASPSEIDESLGPIEDCGALPAEVIDSVPGIAVPFGVKWTNHEAAREWAASILEKRVTFAADGSQLYVEKETTLPIGAVQIGWFENPHDGRRRYEKAASFELLTPKDLLTGQEEPFDPSTRVGERRFHAEAERVGEFISRHKGWQERGKRMPLAFFDGTLLVSFSLPRTTLQKSFVQTMVNLVRHSRDARVPMVGYIDRSFARDLVTMLKCYAGPDAPEGELYDGLMLGHATGVLPDWGDRTRFCTSRRSGLGDYRDPDGRSIVGFTYLRTAAEGAPARLDIPTWCFDDGLINEIADVVRAECTVGIGYPYPLEAADQAAVISVADRDVFFRALQEFATREKLDFGVSRKNASKARRR